VACLQLPYVRPVGMGQIDKCHVETYHRTVYEWGCNSGKFGSGRITTSPLKLCKWDVHEQKTEPSHIVNGHPSAYARCWSLPVEAFCDEAVHVPTQKQQHEFDRNLVSLFWRSLSFTMGNWASSQQNSINTSVYLGKHRKMAIVFLYDMKCGNLSSTDSRAFLIMQFLHYLRCIVAKTRCQMLVSSPKSVWHHKKLKLWWQYYLFFCSSCKRLRTSKY
jgi:hypothetical protein